MKQHRIVLIMQGHSKKGGVKLVEMEEEFLNIFSAQKDNGIKLYIQAKCVACINFVARPCGHVAQSF